MADRGTSHSRRLALRLAIGVAAGALAAWLVPLPSEASGLARVLLGFIVGALVYVVPLLHFLLGMDGAETADHLDGLGASRSVVDVIAVVATLASLGAVGFLIAGASSQSPVLEAGLAIGSVAAGWLLVHTTYGQRYARHYYNAEPGCIDFNGEDKPPMSDFLYVSFDLGMTYQISDTSTKTAAVRRIVLAHCLLSYVLGVAVIGAVINLVSGLAG